VIVCHCKVVNDRAIGDAVAAGARTVSQVCNATGAGRDCGACVFAVKRVVCQHEATVPVPSLEVEGAAS
jgi:bacterioferritin-associated ferredoxin